MTVNSRLIKVLLLCFTISVSLFSCNTTDNNSIDLTKTISKKVHIASIREIIPLETTNDVRLSYIDKSIVDFKHNKVFVLSMMNLYTFDTNGKFNNKIAVGKGPNEMMRIMSFCINSDEQKLYTLNDPQTITELSYNLDVINKYKYKGFNCSDIQHIDKNNLLVYNYATEQEGQKYFVGIYNLLKKEITKKLIPISESPYDRLTIITMNNFPEYNGIKYFTSPNIFGFYEFKKDSFINIKNYELAEYAVPKSFSEKFLKNNGDRIFRQEAMTNDYIPYLLSCFRLKDYYVVILDDPENNCILVPTDNSSQLIKNGSLTEYLNLPKASSLNIPVGYYDNKVVLSLSPVELFSNEDMYTPKHLTIGDRSLGIKYDSNPILIVLE